MKTSSDLIVVSADTSGVEARHSRAVAQLKNGNVVTVWHGVNSKLDSSGSGVFARIFGVDGNIVRDVLLVNSFFTTSDQNYASVAAMKDGGFFVVWQSVNQDGSSWGVYGQKFNANGDNRNSMQMEIKMALRS